MSRSGRSTVDRCRPRYPGVTFPEFETVMETLDGFAALSLQRRARLYLNVCDAVNHFVQYAMFEDQKKPSAVAAELRKVELSVQRVARLTEKWNEDALLHASMYFELISAAKEWQSGNRAKAASLVSHFEHGARIGDVDLGPTQFVRDFFNSALIMKSVVKNTISRLENARAFAPDITAIQYLVGLKLPEIFAKAFGRRFTMTVDAYGSHSKGVEFIVRVLSLFGVSKRDGAAINPQTIKSHYDDARKKGKARRK